MSNKTVTLTIAAAVLFFAFIGLMGCEGSPDRSLTVNAYPPLNQQAGKPTPVMQNVERIRLGIFEQVGDDYRTTAIYQYPQLIKDYYACTTEYERAGSNATITVQSCEHCIEGQCESASQDDVPNINDFLGLCQATVLDDTTTSKCIQGNAICVSQTQAAGDKGFCEFDFAVDETAIDAVEMKNLQTSDATPFTYVIEGFGTADIESTDECTATDSQEGWVCRTNRSGLNTWVRSMPEAVVARGISAPFVYNGNDATTVDILFSLVQNFGIVTLPGDAGDPTLMISPRYGHQAIAVGDGKALIIGGASEVGSNQPSYPDQAEIYDYYTNTFTAIDIPGWSGRAFFTLTQLPSNTTDAVAAEGEDTEPVVETIKFVIAGGQGAAGKVSDVFLGTYNPEDQSVSLEQIGGGIIMTPVAFHTATLLKDGRVLIAGGQSNGGSPVSDAWIVDPTSKTLSSVPSLNKARYKHTATLMPSGEVVIVGGFSLEGESTFTTSWVEVYKPLENSFSRYVYLDDETDNSPITSRVGHIAVPVAPRQADGSVSVKDWADARVAIYGGYRFTEQDESTGKYYYNLQKGNAVNVAYVDSEGRVEVTAWTPNPGYVAAMEKVNPPSYHPTVESEWLWMGDSMDKVFVVGGRRNNQVEFSDWAEIIQFDGGEGGYTFGSFKFGPDGTYDRVGTPFRTAQLSGGRWGMSVTMLDNGMVLIAGGKTYRASQNQQTTLNTAELYNPPTHNRWGNVFKVITDF